VSREPILRPLSALANALARLRLRRHFGDPVAAKHDAELGWWLTEWKPILESGGFNPGDAPAFLDGEETAPTYEGRRWQQARAEVRRVLSEAGIEDRHFFDGKVVIDIGPGPLGFPDACPARLSIGVEPLAERYREHGLLLEGSDAIYLSVGAESIPLVSACADVVVARNSLDHVDDPQAALREAQRLLRPGGTLILNFDVGHAPTVTEPHALKRETVRAALGDMKIEREQASARAHGDGGEAVIIVARRV
jgi:Methyltransferase domain